MDISEGAGAGGEEEEDEFEMMDDEFDFGDEALGESVVFGIEQVVSLSEFWTF